MTRRRLREGTSKVCCVLDKQGEPVTNQGNIFGRIEEFYSELYASISTVHRAARKMIMNMFQTYQVVR